jgi:uroporphyrinogen-III synthase
VEASSDAELGAAPWEAILVTSANAARAIAVHTRYYELRATPVFAVGERSADMMCIAGFSDVTSADGDVDDLAALVAQKVEAGAQLLYLAGEERSGDLAGALPGFSVRTAVIYRVTATDTLPAAAVDALASGIDAVLHFSRRSAETYIKAAHAAGRGEAALKMPTHFCLSAQVARPLAQAGASKIQVAAHPDEAALIALLTA